MLRDRLNEALKSSMKEKNQVAVSTLRLILTAVKDRDIAARSKGNDDGITEPEILQVLQTMVRQRHDSIEMYNQGNRPELAAREAAQQAVNLAARPNLHSICVHGDSPNAVTSAKAGRPALEKEGFELRPFCAPAA